MKYLSPLLLFGLNGVVILNGVGGGTRSAVFFSVLLLGETLTPPAGWTRPWCWAVPCWRNSYIRESNGNDLPASPAQSTKPPAEPEVLLYLAHISLMAARSSVLPVPFSAEKGISSASSGRVSV